MRSGSRLAVIAEAAAWLALAGAAYALTFEFQQPLEVYRYGASGWPRALILLIALVALGQLGNRLGWPRRARELKSEEPLDHAPDSGMAGVRTSLKRAATFILPLGYTFLLPGIGYYVLTPFFLSGYMLLLGERRFRHLVGTALILHALVVVAFTKLFFVQLPVGVWPGFYELNNWLLALVQ